MIIIDAKNCVVGRVGTIAAKKALLGEEVAIINCEQAIVTGAKKRIIEDWQRKYSMGVPRKGPFINRMPDKFVRRMIRGMLPYKNPRGAAALKRIMCYVGSPEGLKGESVEVKTSDALPTMQYMTIGALCKVLGGKDGSE